MMNGFSIPKGLRPPAQGCEERATLGKWNSEIPNPNGVVPPSRAHRSGSKRRNPFGIERRNEIYFFVFIALLLLTLNLSAAAKKPAKMATAKVPPGSPEIFQLEPRGIQRGV